MLNESYKNVVFVSILRNNISEDTQEMPQLWSSSFPRHQNEGKNEEQTMTKQTSQVKLPMHE